MTSPDCKCPVTGDDIIPDLGALLAAAPKRFICPACHRLHELRLGKVADLGEPPEPPSD